MALSFPNQSRSFDATRCAVRFWGHDGAMEASFFVTDDALRRITPNMQFDESGILNAFDLNRNLIGFFERDGLDLLRLGCRSLLRNWRARCDRGGPRPYRPGRHHDLIHRPAFWAVNRIFVQIVEFSAATGAEPFGTQFGFRH